MAKIEKVDALECPKCMKYFEADEVNGFEAYKCPTCEDLHDSEEEAISCCEK